MEDYYAKLAEALKENTRILGEYQAVVESIKTPKKQEPEKQEPAKPRIDYDKAIAEAQGRGDMVTAISLIRQKAETGR